MMTNGKECEEARRSNSQFRAPAGRNHRLPSLALSCGGTVRERGRNRGWILSGVISVNILILGCALVSASAFNNTAISSIELQIFLCILVICTTIWMLHYTIYTSRGDRAVLYKDSHAGPVWLRGGLVLFGICSLIMDIFKIANYVGFLHCDSAVKIIFPVVQALFILVQTYFLWLHAKDCVQLQRNITRCGLVLTLSTNLVLWMSAVTEESLHQTIVPEETNTTASPPHRLYRARGNEDVNCKCSHSACAIFESATYYLYPFNIEYSLFASAMAYVMWKNVGRMVDEHSPHEHRFHLKDVCLGPAAGMVLLVVGLATFVVYEVDVAKEDQGKRDMALMMHYLMNLVAVSLMSICSTVGCVIYRLDERDHVSGKNPTRSLDVVLLVGASMGQFTINYFTIVAVVASGAADYINILNLVTSLLTVIQLGLQNCFIIEGLHREPFGETHSAIAFLNVHVSQSHAEMSSPYSTDTDTKSRRVSTTHSLDVHAAPPQNTLTWKRRALKEVCAFLLLGNAILWIMPAFGARPQFDNTIGTEFYKFTLWAAVVNIGLPFGIFYRMHSVASLFEVFLLS
ncbi:proton channel OTOP2 [Hypomesus transpacificus]|uniref:proton channel OTOP2 n=1 Tax=Hypomesus transpacificus TaxID=137520 RepID=UPI001F0792C1|nr:proton channel OTOP2 [Hypomesus transpacificus]XP_046894672.1 proton channel OTOP2 [Hypomesus transpacificus]